MLETIRSTLVVLTALVVVAACGDVGEASANAPATTTASMAAATTVSIAIDGMVCDGCASAVTEEVAKLPGVHRCAASYTSGGAEVDIDPKTTDAATIVAAIEKLGYKARVR
jgi:Cu+-exporting ATPase